MPDEKVIPELNVLADACYAMTDASRGADPKMRGELVMEGKVRILTEEAKSPIAQFIIRMNGQRMRVSVERIPEEVTK